MSFELHPRLAADTVLVGDWRLSRVLLMNDARFPWLILVPRRPDLVEIVDLAAPDRAQLMEELARASEAVRRLPNVAKLNIGAWAIWCRSFMSMWWGAMPAIQHQGGRDRSGVLVHRNPTNRWRVTRFWRR